MAAIYRSNSRGKSRTEWLTSFHSFNFNTYYNPSRTHFGPLVVVNDDLILSKSGFPMHRHEDMEIITIMIEGSLTHKDNMGNETMISAGEVQVMSAGTGVVHSECNAGDVLVHLYQIWIEPDTQGLTPRYEQRNFVFETNKLVCVASGRVSKTEGNQKGGLLIHQNAQVLLGNFTNFDLEYIILPGRGAYIMVISGQAILGDDVLKEGDVCEVMSSTVLSMKNAKILVIDVKI